MPRRLPFSRSQLVFTLSLALLSTGLSGCNAIKEGIFRVFELSPWDIVETNDSCLPLEGFSEPGPRPRAPAQMLKPLPGVERFQPGGPLPTNQNNVHLRSLWTRPTSSGSERRRTPYRRGHRETSPLPSWPSSHCCSSRCSRIARTSSAITASARCRRSRSVRRRAFHRVRTVSARIRP